MTTALRFCLTLLLTLVALGAATGQGGKQKTPTIPDLRELVEKPQSEFAAVVRRYDADRGNLLRLYTVPTSMTRHSRLKQFASAWLAELKELNPEKLSEPARAEYKELCKRVEAELRQLDEQAKKHAEIEELLPFAATIVELEEARRRLEKVDGAKAAGKLVAMKKQLAQLRAGIEKDDPGVTKAKAGRAAETATGLRTALKNWFNFYHGYDPMFTWWAAEPYKDADAALGSYIAFLGERAKAKAGRDPVEGGRVREPLEVAIRLKGPDVPDLRALLAEPRSELAPVAARFLADRGGGKGKGKGATIPLPFPGAQSPERLAQRKQHFTGWLEALGKLDFDKLSREGQVDYLLIRNQIDRELRRIEQQTRTNDEVARLVPFENIIDLLDEQRKSKGTFENDKALDILKGLAERIDKARGSADVKKVSPAGAAQAARTLAGLRTALGEWAAYAKKAYKGNVPESAHEPAAKALDEYAAVLNKHALPPKARDASGIKGNPIGRDALLSELAAEMIPYAPEELFSIAEKEFEWCIAELKKAAREMGFGDDYLKAIEKVKMLHGQPGEQPGIIRDLAYEAIDYLNKHKLVTVPALAAETWRMEMMSPQRQLVNPFFTGGEVITVSFPTNTMPHEAKLQSMRGNNTHFSRATVHHELIPGHHLQGYMTARYSTHRRGFGTSFWGEGWALYWEMVLYDRGFAKTPEDRVGFMFWRSHRCARILFSLGYHLGTMSPQECIDLLVNRVGHERDNATAEVRRSFTGSYGPLYQAAYMLGGLQIRGLRKELVDSGKMPEREFHDRILKAGSMPITMVRALLTKGPLTRDYKADWRFYAAERAVKVGPVSQELRDRLKLSPFYKKHADAGGLPVLSSEKVSDAALIEAVYLIDRMLENREDVRRAIIKSRVRFAVMSPKEQTTDVPEHSDLTPKDYWDRRARGLGATRVRPAVSCGEENLLNLKGDRYRNENILIHEFAHVIHQMGLNSVDKKFDARLRATYARAKEAGLWKKTYAMENYSEYWAEGVQSYFDCNAPVGGVHNDVNTREKLAKYDPELFKLIDEAFKGSTFRYVRYDRRNAPAKKAEAGSEPFPVGQVWNLPERLWQVSYLLHDLRPRFRGEAALR